MRKTALVLAALLAVAGICVMLWPVFTGHRLQADTDAAVQEFLAERDEPEQQYPELLTDLQEYNRQLYAEKQCNLVDLEACEEPAAELATYGIEDEIIGVLEIPAMELTMPVYLGASDAHLASGAAVLGNTSAPHRRRQHQLRYRRTPGMARSGLLSAYRPLAGGRYREAHQPVGNPDVYSIGYPDYSTARGREN